LIVSAVWSVLPAQAGVVPYDQKRCAINFFEDSVQDSPNMQVSENPLFFQINGQPIGAWNHPQPSSLSAQRKVSYQIFW
jgi:hypothetical protein